MTAAAERDPVPRLERLAVGALDGDAARDPERAGEPPPRRDRDATAVGSTSSPSGRQRVQYEPDGQRSIMPMIAARTSLSAVPSIIAGIRFRRPTQNAACMHR